MNSHFQSNVFSMVRFRALRLMLVQRDWNLMAEIATLFANTENSYLALKKLAGRGCLMKLL